MDLKDIIIERIRSTGPISFHDYMETALYHPGLGYYVTAPDKIGKTGDYYTSPHYTSIFGEMIATQLEEIYWLLGEERFTIVEYGAGTGLLCYDILRYLQRHSSIYDKVDYCIIEKSPAMRSRQQQLLPSGVRWINDINEIAPVYGCILANEVVDNFAVHVVKMEDELMEMHVDYQESWVEHWLPARRELKDYFSALNVDLPKDSRAEVNLQAIQWMGEIAQGLERGFALTIDYGHTSAGLYSTRRSEGTLMCFHQHGVNDRHFDNIGQQDITAHVNFSALQHWGAKFGLEVAGFTTQSSFLLSLGLSAHLKKVEQEEGNNFSMAKKMMMIQAFMLDMGKKIKVLVQQKGMDDVCLSGLRIQDLRLDDLQKRSQPTIQ